MSWIVDHAPFEYGRFVAGYDEFDPAIEEIMWVIQRLRPEDSGSGVREVDDEWIVDMEEGHFECLGERELTVPDLLKKVADKVEASG